MTRETGHGYDTKGEYEKFQTLYDTTRLSYKIQN